MATPNPEAIKSYEERMAALNAQMQKFNAATTAFVNIMDGQFRDAGEAVVELHNPIYKLNSAVISASGNMKKLGLDMESAMVNASMKAQILVQRMEMLRARTIALPRAFMAKIQDGARVESERISAAAGIMRSEYAQSIPEAQRVLSQVRAMVIKESAPLPGDTFTHLEVLGQTIDDAMKMAKDAGKTMEEAQKFSANVAGQIGAIGGTAGADQYSIIRFANALMSGSLSPRARLDLVERNPAVKNAMKEVFKAQGVRTLEGVGKEKRMEVVQELLEKAMPASQLEAASQSFQGAIEGFNTSFRSLFDFNRTLKDTFEYYKGPDITVFDELKEIVIDLINPLKSLVDAIIANPVLDPMTNLARSISLLNGFFGNTTIRERDLEGMELKTAGRELGFVDYLKYLGTNATDLVDRTVNREKHFQGRRSDEATYGMIGKDIPSIIMNNLSSKFRAGIDAAFAEIQQFLSMGRFINDLDFGGSIGVVMAELSNNVIYLFNNLLPILIEQTTSLFRRFKEQINIVDLLSFLQLFGGFKNIWAQLQQKISSLAEDIPKWKNKFTAVFGGFFAALAGVGTVIGLFGKIVVSVMIKLQSAILNLVSVIQRETGKFGGAAAANRTRRRSLEMSIFERIDSRVRGAGTQQERQGIIAGLTNRERQIYDRGVNTLGVGGFVTRHDRTAEMVQRFTLNPLNMLFNLGDPSKAKNTNFLQNMSGTMGKMTMPLMMAANMGVIPGGVAQSVMFGGLGMGLLGNILGASARMGLPGLRGISQERREKIGRIHGRIFGNIKEGVMSGDRRKVGTGMRALMASNFMGIKGITKFLKKIPGMGKLLGAVAPILTGLLANFWLIVGTITLLFGIFKRAYAASPELRKAVKRFMTGMRNLFAGVSRFIIPLYKNFIVPIFKVIGDVLAWWLNAVMNLWNKITGGRLFGEEGVTTNVTKEQAAEVGEERRRERTKTERRQIEKGKETARNRYMGNIPGITAKYAFSGFPTSAPQVISAAQGFGMIDVPSLMNAATMEAKMMPANEKLVLANTSETILTREQLAAGRMMSQSKHYNVPKIDIMIANSGNQNPQTIANEVAAVLMTKLRDTENMS